MAGKKRKVPLQSTTLHDFFKQPSESSQSNAHSVWKSAPTYPHEIIVIDSDDEENVDPRPGCKKNVSIAKQEISAVNIALGTPHLLAHDKERDVQRDNQELLASSVYLDFPSMRHATSAAVANTLNQIATPNIADISPEHLDHSADDHVWALNDDEVLTFGVDEDIDLASGQDTLEEQNDTPQDDFEQKDPEESCPLCALPFLDLSQDDVQDHVNACIDNLQPIDAVPPTDHLPIPRIPLQFPRGRSHSSNAFSVLMSGYKENEVWKEATEVEASALKGTRRKAPFYKVLQGMPIAVDAFRYGKIPDVTAYFLTHAHSDHYTNLSSSWKNGPIYCSETTGNLIVHLLGVDREWVHPLPMDVPTLIPNTGGVEVTVIEANHCPGSSLFLFSGKQTTNAGDSAFRSPGVGTSNIYRYLHCGDFRASPQHVLHPAIKGKKLDLVYLDTTYLNAKYCFPPQPQVISACAELAKQIVDNNSRPTAVSNGAIDAWCKSGGKDRDEASDLKRGTSKSKVLVVVGTYSIGKERIVKAIAKALKSKVFCDARKRAILHCQADIELHAMLTSDPRLSIVHVVPLQHISVEHMEKYLVKMGGAFDRVLAFRPTGWTYTPPSGTDLSPSIAAALARDRTRSFTSTSLKPARGSNARIMLYGVPYSEHSSFLELTAFALSCDWVKMIATVNVGSAVSRGKMQKWFDKWASERKAGKGRLWNEDGVVAYRASDYW